MAIVSRGLDRRARRTRQMLQQAFKEVVSEKGFRATTVQDITERADVNRGTFYAHFEDKYALLDSVIREQFQGYLARTLPAGAGWDRESLRELIRTVLNYFADKYYQCHRSENIDPLIERAVQAELNELLLRWLKRSAAGPGPVSPEVVARVVSWSIFGAAMQLGGQAANASSIERMAREILEVLMKGVAGLTPTKLPRR